MATAREYLESIISTAAILQSFDDEALETYSIELMDIDEQIGNLISDG